MSLGQIALRLDLPRSTIQRITGALQAERLVVATSAGLRLGPGLHALAGAAHYNTVVRCRPYLADLSRITGETVDLSVLRGGRMIFLDQAEGTARLRTVSAVGASFPLTTTANRRACLAALPMEEALRLAAAEWSRAPTQRSLAAFQQMLDDIRRTGLAYDLDDHSDGISAIGFCMTDVSGELHALSVPIPSSRFAEKRDAVVAALTTLRPKLNRALVG